MSAFAKHVFDNWTPVMDRLMDNFGPDGTVPYEKLLNTAYFPDFPDRHLVIGAQQYGKKLFELLSKHPYQGVGETMITKFKEMVPNWQNYLTNAGSTFVSVPQIKVVERIVEVPRIVEKVVEKIVQVPVEKIVS